MDKLSIIALKKTGAVDINAAVVAAQAAQAAAEEAQEAAEDAAEDSEASAATSAAMTGLAPAFSDEATYAVGDYVLEDGKLYRCTTAVTTAGSFDSDDWTQVTLAPDVRDLKRALSEFTRNIWPGARAATLIKDTTNYYRLSYTPVGTTSLVLSFLPSDTTLTSVGVRTFKNDVSVENLSVDVTPGTRSSVVLSNTDFDVLRIYIKSSAGSGSTITISDIQLETGTTPTDYIAPFTAVDHVAREEISIIDEKIDAVTEMLNLAEFTSGTLNGVTYTATTNGLILDGSPSENAGIPIGTLKAGTYYGDITIKSGTASSAVALRYTPTGGSDTYWTGTNVSGTTITLTTNAIVTVRCNVGNTLDDCQVEVFLTPTNQEDTATDYVARNTNTKLEAEITTTNSRIDTVRKVYLPVNELSKYNAFTCVNKTEIKLDENSHILAYGDSITHGGTWGTSWVDFVCQMVGCTATNKAETGALFGEEVRTSNYFISTQMTNTSAAEWEAATLVVIAAGTNDAGYDTTETELYSKVQAAITTVRTNTQVPILFITPIKRGPSDDDANYWELPKVSGIIEHVALINHCSVICGLNFPIPSHDTGVISNLTQGNIHPNDYGGYIYAMSVLQCIL